MSESLITERPPASILKRLSFGAFLVSAAIVVFFLAFNYSIPFLKERVDHAILDMLSRIGALVYPIAVAMTGLSYAGIILASRRPRFGYCANCGHGLRGLNEGRCTVCGTNRNLESGQSLHDAPQR